MLGYRSVPPATNMLSGPASAFITNASFSVLGCRYVNDGSLSISLLPPLPAFALYHPRLPSRLPPPTAAGPASAQATECRGTPPVQTAGLRPFPFAAGP